MGFFKPINVGKYVILFSIIVIRSGNHISEDGNIVDDATKWKHGRSYTTPVNWSLPRLFTCRFAPQRCCMVPSCGVRPCWGPVSHTPQSSYFHTSNRNNQTVLLPVMFPQYPWHLVLQPDGILEDHILTYHILVVQFS